jgi:putative membrane protein
VRFVIKVLINAAALWVADLLVEGIVLQGSLWAILLVALVFGLVNAVLKPILKIFSLPALILTLGLFAIEINTALLAITAALMDNLQIPGGFWSALLGSLIISVISAVLHRVVREPD